MKRVLLTLAITALAGVANAQSFADLGASAPTPGPNDISQLSSAGFSDLSGGYYTDKTGAPVGQSFTTGGNPLGYYLNSVAVKTVAGSAGGGGTGPEQFQVSLYQLTTGVSGTTATLLGTTLSLNTFSFTAGDWIQVTGLSQYLQPNTTYAYTFGRLSTGSGWCGLSDAGSNPYAGGAVCAIPPAGGSVNFMNNSYDATFSLGLSLNPASPTIVVRELWDNIGRQSLAGKTNGTTSYGFVDSSPWYCTNTLMDCDVNFDVDPGIGLPVSGGSQGGLWSSLGNGTANNDPGNWAQRLLAPSSQIDFSKDGVYYFSFDFNNGGPSAGGMGFATGTNSTDHFVGAGVTWGSYPLNTGGDIGNSAYITTGTFGDVSDTNTSLAEAQGVYAIKAYGDTNLVVSGSTALLVGRLTTTAAGNSKLDIKVYATAITGISNAVDTNVSDVVWDASYSFTETNNMTSLLIWQNSEGSGYPYFGAGALRVSKSWGEVVGVEALKPTFSPTPTVFAGTPVTLTGAIRLNNAQNSGQVGWYFRRDGVPLTDPAASGVNALTASYTLANPMVADSGYYDLVVTNAFGASISPVAQLTVEPPGSPSFLMEPGNLPGTRYAGGAFIDGTSLIAGTPPYTYQWHHNGTNLPSQTSLTLNLSNLQPSDAGAYYLSVTNAFGGTNSVTNNLTILPIPTSGFISAVITNGAWGYWPLNQTTNDWKGGTVAFDFVGGHDGASPDTGNIVFGLAGPDYPGLNGPNNLALQTQNNGRGSRVNLPVTQYSNTMTICGWVNPGGNPWNGLFYDVDGNGYGDNYGVNMTSSPNVGCQWGGSGTSFNSGIAAPQNNWSFVALVVEPTAETIYVGTSGISLQSASNTGLSLTSATRTGPLCVGRIDYSWASPGNAWAGFGGEIADVAVFYQSLSPQAITDLFVSAVGLQIKGTPDGAGNLVLEWLPGLTLQKAVNVEGPYTDVAGSPAPPYPVSMTGSAGFYRVRQ